MKKVLSNTVKGYTWARFRKDLLAGIIVGIIALPLGMSFAIASGVKPEYGIYSSFVAGIIVSIFGGSRFQIAGPTGAFIPVLLGIVLTYGYQDLLVAGMMAGVLLCLMGIFKLGTLIKFIPRPVTIGFTAGIAVTIFMGQVGNFLGLTGMEKHESFIANMKEIWLHLDSWNFYSVLISCICMFVLFVFPKILPRIPAPLIGLVITTGIAMLFFKDALPTIGSAYGEIPSTFPPFQFPDMTFANMSKLIGPAFVIAMLGGIESLLSAVVADGMTNTKHNSNRELIGQGIANIVTPMFGGIPATGAIARTATNINNGATSRVSGVIHGIFVLLTLLVLAPVAINIPIAAMAPILMLVAWNMSERKTFQHIIKLKSGDTLVLVITFLLTVFASLTVAVEVGLLLAVVLFAKQMGSSMQIEETEPEGAEIAPHLHDKISVFTIRGPLFFGAAQIFQQNIMKAIHVKPEFLILRMGKVPIIDATAEGYFHQIEKEFSKQGGQILITGLTDKAKESLKGSGLYDRIGEEHFFLHTEDAVHYAENALSELSR
ncbi:SulP family inorganic anion transporter [Listeria innocua]